ncbi:type II toxin-antitoxin system RelB family antitoxin [Deferribacter abyssi]|uniref:type II toxin-antitoxin system RelB family antitoxin n=1 Tax=Deferribacter abyssi TaxID=213806 RepID=UPI003C1D7FB6
MGKAISIRLPDDLNKRLDILAKKTKRTKSFYIREALSQTIEDLEDAYLAEKEYEDFKKSKKAPIPLEEIEEELEL